MIKEFNRENLKLMREEINQALAAITEKYGVTTEIGNIRYSTNSFHTKLTVTVGAVNGQPTDKPNLDFTTHCFIYGMVPSDLGKTFIGNQGVSYKLVGLKPNNHKYPFIGERQDGKRFKFAADAVRRGLGK